MKKNFISRGLLYTRLNTVQWNWSLSKNWHIFVLFAMLLSTIWHILSLCLLQHWGRLLQRWQCIHIKMKSMRVISNAFLAKTNLTFGAWAYDLWSISVVHTYPVRGMFWLAEPYGHKQRKIILKNNAFSCLNVIYFCCM